MLVAKSGLLVGKKATTHHNAFKDLTSAGAEVVTAKVVDEGKIITSGGITSGIDLALWILERYYGKNVTVSVERQLEYNRTGPVWQV